jgi:transcriptional adapter 3
MSSSLVQFITVQPFRSQIVKNTPDAVPPTEDLEALQTNLIELRQHTSDRAKKAEDDLRTIDEYMKRMKEKEKGKAKVVEKMKRECALSIWFVLADLTAWTFSAPQHYLPASRSP